MTAVPRRVAGPLVVLASPPLFLLYREAELCSTPIGCRTLALAGYAVLVVAALPAALLLARTAAAGRAPPWVAPRPDDRTLAGLVAIVGGLAAFVLLSAVDAVPGWLGGALAPVGALLGFPLLVVHSMVVGVANAVGGLPRAAELLGVAAGVALSAVWWYVLAASAARWLSHVNEPRD